jgi:hypothetical protein
MGSLFQDVRYGFRSWARSPGFTMLVVCTLAVGIARPAGRPTPILPKRCARSEESTLPAKGLCTTTLYGMATWQESGTDCARDNSD